MRTKKGFNLRTLGNEFVLTAEGLEVSDVNKMVSMNASAAFLWKEVEGKDFDAETLTGLLLGEYDIDREVAEKDAARLVRTWKEANIVEDY
ncbi:MAG: PqqD family protein [Bacteroidales bacterium]|nr:PqqD family protein [Bacteroidales bacterium]